MEEVLRRLCAFADCLANRPVPDSALGVRWPLYRRFYLAWVDVQVREGLCRRRLDLGDLFAHDPANLRFVSAEDLGESLTEYRAGLRLALEFLAHAERPRHGLPEAIRNGWVTYRDLGQVRDELFSIEETIRAIVANAPADDDAGDASLVHNVLEAVFRWRDQSRLQAFLFCRGGLLLSRAAVGVDQLRSRRTVIEPCLAANGLPNELR